MMNIQIWIQINIQIMNDDYNYDDFNNNYSIKMIASVMNRCKLPRNSSISMMQFLFSRQKIKTRPTAPLQLLRNKLFQSQSQPQKLQYLNSLLKDQDTLKLQNYFESCTIDGFHIEEIFFYLTHKSLFKPPTHIVKYSLINNHNLDVYTKFIISIDIDALDDQFMQTQLIKSFNQMCRSMTASEMAFCLNKIIDFSQNSIKKVDEIAVSEAISSLSGDNNELEMLEIFYCVEELKINVGFNSNKILEKIEEIKQLVLKQETQIKYLYFLKCFEYKFGVTTSVSQNQTRQAKILFKISVEDPSYAVKFLYFYPHLVYLVKLNLFTPKLYIEYLQYLKLKRQSDRNFVVINHQFPYDIFHKNIKQSAQVKIKAQQFNNIFNLRLELGLDQPVNLGIHTKKFFTPTFNIIYFFMRFLDTNNINHNEVWILFEEAITHKFQLNLPSSKRKQISKIFKQFDIIGVFKLLGSMSMNRLGSYNFWIKMNRMIFQIFQEQETIRSISKSHQNRFLIYCFQLCRSNNLPLKVQQKMINLALIAISNNRWSFKQLSVLVECLSFNKFGDDDLWYGIENKLLQSSWGRVDDELDQKRIRKIVGCFARMKKGSFKFFNKASKLPFSLQPSQNKKEQESNFQNPKF